MKRILSVAIVFAMIFALAVSALAVTKTEKHDCKSMEDIDPFFMEATKANLPTFTTDGELSFKNPAENNTGVDCFIRRDGSLKEAYGAKFTLSFEMCFNAIAGDTSANVIFQLQIKDATSAWGANHKFFTVTGDGAGAYTLTNAGDDACEKIALETGTWYDFAIDFDLENDNADVKYAEHGKDLAAAYTAVLNCQGDIPTMLVGQCDSRDGYVYDYLLDSITFTYEGEEDTTAEDTTAAGDDTTAEAGTTTEAGTTAEAGTTDVPGTDAPADDAGLPVPAIIGIAVAVVAIIAIIAVVASKKKK